MNTKKIMTIVDGKETIHREFKSESYAVVHYNHIKDKYRQGQQITGKSDIEDLTNLVLSSKYAKDLVGSGIARFVVALRGRGTCIWLERTDLSSVSLSVRELIKEIVDKEDEEETGAVEISKVELVKTPATQFVPTTFAQVVELMYNKRPFITWSKHYGKSVGRVLVEEPSYVHWMYQRMYEHLEPKDELLYDVLTDLFDNYSPIIMPVIQAAKNEYYARQNNVPCTTTLDLSKLKVLQPEPEVAPEPAAPITTMMVLPKSKDELVERAAAIEAEQEIIQRMEAELAEKKSALGQEKQYVADELDRIKQEELARRPVVTDHAVVRYLERVLEMDVDSIREKILGEFEPELLEAINTLGDGLYPVQDSHRLRIVDSTVVTVLQA